MEHTMRERSKTMAASRSSRKLRQERAGHGCRHRLPVAGLRFDVGGRGRFRPHGTRDATSGSVATISGSTMEVQSTTAQTAVTWTPTTTFSETATETVSAVAVGDCLTVTGTPAKKSKTTIAARSITISKASTSGTCTSGFGGRSRRIRRRRRVRRSGWKVRCGHGRARRRWLGSGETPPSGSFPGRSGGSARGGFPGAANFAIATGKVTAIKGSTVTVSGTLLSQLFNRSSQLEVDEARPSPRRRTSRSRRRSRRHCRRPKPPRRPRWPSATA